MADNYGWCQSCGALVFGSSQCHKCGGKVKPFCVDMTLVKQAERIKELETENKRLKTQLEGCEKSLNATNKVFRELEYGIIHIKNVLEAAIERPTEIAVDWKEFLLKYVEALKKG